MIEIYILDLSKEPIEKFPYEGNLYDLIQGNMDEDLSKVDNPSAAVFLNGNQCPIPFRDWPVTEIVATDTVRIVGIQNGGVFKLIGSLLTSVFSLILPFLMPGGQNNNQRGGTAQGQALESADIRANSVRKGDPVPVMIGTCRRYGDYLNEPRRYFVNRRDQYLTFLTCISADRVHVDYSNIFIGDTPLQDIPNAEAWIHEPGADLTGHEPAELWHICDSVGGTSAGTAGLVLSALVANQDLVLADSYQLDGPAITPVGGSFPEAWGRGTQFSMVLAMSYNMTTETVGSFFQQITRFHGNFKHLLPLQAGKTVHRREIPVVNSNVGIALFVRDFEVDENGDGWLQFYTVTPNENPNEPPEINPYYTGETGQKWIGFTQGATGSRAYYTVISRNGQTLTIEPSPWYAGWQGWQAQTNSMIYLQYERGDLYGEYTTAFIGSPSGQKNTVVEVDLFAANGLRYTNDDGNPELHGVTIEVEYSDADGQVAPVTQRYYYEDATPDSLGFTERYVYPVPVRARVRVRRIGRISADPRVSDEVTWYGLKTLMPFRKSYPWACLSVRIKSGGAIGSKSENQLNVIGTGYSRELLPNGTWAANETPNDTIPGAFSKVILSKGGSLEDIHPDIVDLNNDHWIPRGDTFGYVMDRMTVKDALDSILQAGLAELTQEDGYYRPVKDVPRSVFEQGFSPLNIAQEVTIRFENHRSESVDGLYVEYQDKTTWETETIACFLPGDLGIRTKTIKIRGANRRAAYNWGMRERLKLEYRKMSYEFETEMEGLNTSYLSFISIIDSMRDYGQASMIYGMEMAGTKAYITVADKLIRDGNGSFVVAIRGKEGEIVGPFPVDSVSDDGETVIIETFGQQLPTIDPQQELPHLYFGESHKWNRAALVTSVQPDDGLNVKLMAIEYTDKVYTYDHLSPGAINE